MNESHLRMSDAEREQAAAELGEHYAQGRIDTDEHAERLDRIWAARTRAELAPVFADLPGPHQRRPATAPWAASTPTGSRRTSPARRGLPFPVALLLVLLVGATVLTHLPWVLLGVLAWVVVGRGACRPRRSRHPHWS